MSRCYTPPLAVFNRWLLTQKCVKCQLPFQKGEPVVNKNQNEKATRTLSARKYNHGAGSIQSLRWYHKKCFTDAKGVPIYE